MTKKTTKKTAKQTAKQTAKAARVPARLRGIDCYHGFTTRGAAPSLAALALAAAGKAVASGADATQAARTVGDLSKATAGHNPSGQYANAHKLLDRLDKAGWTVRKVSKTVGRRSVSAWYVTPRTKAAKTWAQANLDWPAPQRKAKAQQDDEQ